MAWPFTPATTYVATTTPAIKAADLNSFQSAINGVYGATLSLAAVVVDGTGNAPVTPEAGTVLVSKKAGGTSVPTPAFTFGTLYADCIPKAMGSVNYGVGAAAPTVNHAVNLASLSRTGTGVLQLVLGTALANFLSGYELTVSINGGSVVAGDYVLGDVTANNHIRLQYFNAAGTLKDGGASGLTVSYKLHAPA